MVSNSNVSSKGSKNPVKPNLEPGNTRIEAEFFKTNIVELWFWAWGTNDDTEFKI